MKKFATALVCAIVCLALCLPGFAVEMSAPGEVPIVKETMSFNIVAPDTSYIGDLNTNTLTTWIKDTTGVQLVFQEIPSDAVKEKVNLMLASDELPDAFMGCGITADDEVKYGSEGVFIALNDLIDKYGVYTKKVYEQQPTLPSAITAPDGNIYGLPGINECYHCFYSQRAWLNQAWMDKLGLKYPNTWDELHDVLSAFKTKDPNGDGTNDEVALTGSKDGWNTRLYDFLFNSFLYYDSSNIRLNNGKVEFTPVLPEYKEAVEAVKAWVDEGLIDKTGFTQTSEQYLTLGSNPDKETIGVGVAALWWSFVPQDAQNSANRSRDYVPLSPVEGPKGNRTSPLMSSGVSTTGDVVITDACQNPDVLFRMFDYMYSDEATLRAQMGEEGVDYNKPAEGATGINGKPALYEIIEKTGDAVDNYTTYMPNIMLSNRTSDFRLGQAADYNNPETQWSIEPRLYNSTAKYFAPYAKDEMHFPVVFLTADESGEMTSLKTQINDYADEQTALFLTGERDMSEWDAYISQFDALGLKNYTDLLQKAYDRQYSSAAK